MFCDQCGRNNKPGCLECSYCGAGMPRTTECGGFADILSFEEECGLGRETSSKVHTGDKKEKLQPSAGVLELQSIEKKMRGIEKSINLNSWLCRAALGVGVFILVSSLVWGSMVIRAVQSSKNEMLDRMVEIQKEEAGGVMNNPEVKGE